MNIKRSTLNIILIVSLALALIVMAVAVGARKWPRVVSPGTIGPQKQDERVTDTLPPVISSIKGIEVVSLYRWERFSEYHSSQQDRQWDHRFSDVPR